jgi:hypothetical protein
MRQGLRVVLRSKVVRRKPGIVMLRTSCGKSFMVCELDEAGAGTGSLSGISTKNRCMCSLYGLHLRMELTVEGKMDHRVRAGEIAEDQLTAYMESQSAKWPTSLFLGAAIGSIAASLVLKVAGRKDDALFVGQWAAPFLLLGIYNKLVKQHGSDNATAQE